MKRILAAMLIISMTAGITLQNVKASDEEIYYSESQIENIAQNYTENESLFEKCLCSDEGIAYWKMMHKINADHAFTWALDISSKMIEEYPDKKRYAEILSCLISMQTGNVVEQVSEQSRFDHLKNTEDVIWDAAGLANELIGKTGVIGSVNDIVGSVFDGASTIIESKEIAKYYETVYQDYAESTMFLDAIVSYSENSELKEVAGELKKASDSLLAKRLECLADINEEVAKYEAKFFYENLGVELLKQSDVYNTDDAILSYFNGEIVEQKMYNYGFRYIEGANLFRDFGGHMDEYYDKIYTLENGNFVLLYSGEYGAEDNSKVEYGDDGMPVYRYFWENEEVSSEEYERKLNEVYDTEKEVKIFQDAQYDSEKGRYVGNGLCDYQEIIEAIEETSVLN